MGKTLRYLVAGGRRLKISTIWFASSVYQQGDGIVRHNTIVVFLLFCRIGSGEKRQEFCQGSEKSAKAFCHRGVRGRKWYSCRHSGAASGKHQRR